jgi:antitoxin component of MazEF toxin-antitoxin module
MIAKVLRWGNSFGIRISADDARRHGLREGQEIVVELKAKAGQKVDLSHLETFEGPGNLSTTHDEVDWA